MTSKVLSVGALIAALAGLGCGSSSSEPVLAAQSTTPSVSSGQRYQPGWESPREYSRSTGREIGHRGRSGNGPWSYNLNGVDVAMRVRVGGARREEWLEWWQIDCLKGAQRAAYCALKRLVLDERDRVGAVLPQIWSEDTYGETLKIEEEEWEHGSLAIATTSPLEQIRIRVEWQWKSNVMELRDFSAAGSRERIGIESVRIESVDYLPVTDSQVLTVPIGIRGLQRPTFD